MRRNVRFLTLQCRHRIRPSVERLKWDTLTRQRPTGRTGRVSQVLQFRGFHQRSRCENLCGRRRFRKSVVRLAVRESRHQVTRWKERGDWVKLQCIELLFVRGWANKEVATELNITEQQVANFKFDFLARMRSIIRKQGLSEDVFPEIYSE